ncbi:PREDICTED: uncharacterized protein LOC106807860 [Priapulus caudatus]|uniref:Uncharacterized protein LOC106807860 n=1 Tax=Priapulus caudatus TaxID=37621 RepID=A0ABM1E0W2_PRICU|nr:PREDICTED: uncharacterized protein LOC106807860 [Priapulus caudatus]
MPKLQKQPLMPQLQKQPMMQQLPQQLPLMHQLLATTAAATDAATTAAATDAATAAADTDAPTAAAGTDAPTAAAATDAPTTAAATNAPTTAAGTDAPADDPTVIGNDFVAANNISVGNLNTLGSAIGNDVNQPSHTDGDKAVNGKDTAVIDGLPDHIAYSCDFEDGDCDFDNGTFYRCWMVSGCDGQADCKDNSTPNSEGHFLNLDHESSECRASLFELVNSPVVSISGSEQCLTFAYRITGSRAMRVMLQQDSLPQADQILLIQANEETNPDWTTVRLPIHAFYDYKVGFAMYTTGEEIGDGTIQIDDVNVYNQPCSAAAQA